MKEWYFFDQYGVNHGDRNAAFTNKQVIDDSLLFGCIEYGGSKHYIFKYTHKQGFIKKTLFTGVNDYISLTEICIDTLNKNLYTFCRSGIRPPLYKYIQAVVFKLDYDLNILDSLVIGYSTIYEPSNMVFKNNKLYLTATNQNYFGVPIKCNLTILNNNLQLLNRKVVGDTTISQGPIKLFFEKDGNIRLFIKGLSGATNSLKPPPIMLLDTNLNVLQNKWYFNRSYPTYPIFGPPSIITKTKSGYIYTSEQNPFAQWPQYHVYYHFKVTENEDTLKTTYFYTKSVPSNQYYPTKYNYNIRHLQSIKNNYLLGLGSEEIFGSTSINQNNYKFLIIDSSLNIINTFDVLKFTTAKLDLITAGKTKIGQTPSGMYYISSQAKDSTQVNYKGVYYLMTIDSTAKISTNPSPTITATEQEWQNINIYPNPTKDIVKFAIPPNTNYNVNVYNNLGQLLMSINDVNVNREINLQGLPIGIYHFTFYETNLKKNITKKLVLE